ncbi:MAG: phosphohistidine phosphatase SixA [Chthoniobacterales bacterium]|nr:phosphohistidine phosphatase SixA [Chthoniobacterales bacterium]
MKVYFLRHGKADWPNWDKPDDERPLNKKGRKQMGRVVKFLCNLEPKISLVLSSPLPRALQTAEIAADYLGLELEEEPALGKGFDATKLRRILKERADEELMIVGHEPSFSTVIGELTGGRVKLPKAGIAVVDVSDGAREGELVWLLPPRITDS